MENNKKTNKKQEKIILMSIMSYYARQIFNGTKSFEFRKSPLRIEDLNKKIYIYSAKEDKAIVGSVKVKKIHCGNVEEILKMTGYNKRTDGSEIVDYYGNCSQCYALELYDIKKFEKPLTLKEMRKLDPNIQLPQYFTYFRPNSPIYEKIKELNNQNFSQINFE